ncbi:MAG: hypothetical protein KJ905_02085 [Nanoarchaeota archaeon]|nr:hypothetical protein [Nanoarchaeota archaeon]MBU1501542.1 hypothetical protein [Nanoarchaeota archaeon]MBU2459155.1 hypothetical protein [Nanoarchaeota archaeon]
MVNTNVEVSKKVSYNPLKMWGSWVSVALWFFFNLIAQEITPAGNPPPFFNKEIIMPIVIFFLVGWGIHSLVRYLRNR